MGGILGGGYAAAVEGCQSYAFAGHVMVGRTRELSYNIDSEYVELSQVEYAMVWNSQW